MQLLTNKQVIPQGFLPHHNLLTPFRNRI